MDWAKLEMPEAVARWIEPERKPELGPGKPNEAALVELRAMEPADLFTGNVADEAMAGCCLSGLFLLHDALEESHRISQGIETTEGSVWHGIMHRREPDAGNAKYWFRQAGSHPVGEALAAEATRQPGAETLAVGPWEPARFVDFCEEARLAGGAPEKIARTMQRIEWDLLFAHCYAKARGL